ncbi:hypothetical protein BU14_2936s0002 [Porphyra umbilicalis]|uniref:Uncharacterized protein n=1 Tax=Porphyra umbilicalis TaxID=2786 RepID=A0A1X6NJ39_PORUM|nr:hypothetical protein BU14_2936s0002 [Porphyra umbilicalis]|eukprot:OSX68363.1 hypothetical protein BU14_2936s0002 [Porphyra umbilicalis]
MKRAFLQSADEAPPFLVHASPPSRPTSTVIRAPVLRNERLTATPPTLHPCSCTSAVHRITRLATHNRA